VVAVGGITMKADCGRQVQGGKLSSRPDWDINQSGKNGEVNGVRILRPKNV